MDKILRKLLALCAVAVLAVSMVACQKDNAEPEPEPEPVVPVLTIQGVSENGEVANAATSWDSASIKVSTENIVEFAWMLQTADEKAPSSESIVFKNGTVVKPEGASTTLEFKDLARLTDYVVYIAAKVPATEEATRADGETEFYGEVIKVKFSTPDYSDEVTVVKVKPDGFDLHVKFPASVREKGSSIKWGVSNIAMYNTNKYQGASDASLLDLNDGVYPAARFVNDTTITIDEAHRYAMDADGNLIVDEWMGEPIYYWDFIAPGEPLVLFMSEVAYSEEDYWGWGPGWYDLPFDNDAYSEAMRFADPENMPNEADYWEEGAWYKKVEVTALAPEQFDGTVSIETKDLAPNGGTVVLTPDDKTNVFCVGIYDETTYNQYLDIYLGGNEDYLQWFSTSYYGMTAGFTTVWADYDFDGTNDGPQEVNLADLFWEFTPGGTYHVILTSMASREATQEEIDSWADMGTGLMPDQMSQNFQHITFTLPDYTMDAPEMVVTPLEPTSPFEVSFNVKCVNYTESPVVEVAYAANYLREFNEELEYSTYADLCESNRYYNAFSYEEVEQMNSEEGCVITFPSREDAITRLAVMGWNQEGRPSVFEGENPDAVADASSGVVPDAPRVESELFTELNGEWTATATVNYRTYGQISEDEWGYIYKDSVMTTKVTIGEVTYPETLSQEIYDLYEENGVSKDAADAYFEEFKAQADIYNKKVRGQNRILCTGWSFDAINNTYSQLRTASPWDLFLDNSGYNASDVSSLFYDFGAKWYLQVNEAGDVFVPVNCNRLAPLTRWTNGQDLHLAGITTTTEDYIYVYALPLNEEDMDDVSKWPNLPVEVSEDKQTITIKSFEYEGDTYYPNAYSISSWDGSMSPFNTTIVSEVVLTKGWSEADEDTDVNAVRKNATELKNAVNAKSVSNAAIEAQSAPKSRTVYVERKPAAHKIEAKAVSFEQSIENMKQFIEKKKAARK